jgi:HSP20 family protein
MLWKNGYKVAGWPANAWWNDMWRLNQQMDHLFGGTRGPIQSEYPLLQAWSGDDGLVLMANMPGIDKDSLDITVEGRTLTIGGSRNAEKFPDGAHVYRQERADGQFSRSVELPFDVDVEAIKASYADGVLEIDLPRVPEDKPKKITVTGS